jgi:hypothetical protein
LSCSASAVPTGSVVHLHSARRIRSSAGSSPTISISSSSYLVEARKNYLALL